MVRDKSRLIISYKMAIRDAGSVISSRITFLVCATYTLRLVDTLEAE